MGVHWKDWCWSRSSNTLATWWKIRLTGKEPDAGKRLKAGGEGDNRGSDGWMASLTRWTWVWVNSGSWWWTGRPGVLLFMGSQRVRHDCVTELNWDIILKSRDITLSTKVHLVEAMVFPVVMYGCESWTVKKAEHRRIDAFELWCWRRLLRIPWTARRSNQSILKEIDPEYSLEELMLKLKLQYFGYLMWRADSLENTLMLGKIEGRRRRGQQRMRLLDGITDSVDMRLRNSRSYWWTGKPGVLQSMGSQRVGHNWTNELN